jgi:hypothetical protein
LLKDVFFSADPDADFDGDGAVTFLDLATMKAFSSCRQVRAHSCSSWPPKKWLS